MANDTQKLKVIAVRFIESVQMQASVVSGVNVSQGFEIERAPDGNGVLITNANMKANGVWIGVGEGNINSRTWQVVK
jgi:hypothetical protein